MEKRHDWQVCRMLKKLIKSALGRPTSKPAPAPVVPPKQAPAKDELFDGDDELFKRLAADARTYFEYGCGASTRWVLANTKASIRAVDTHKDWIAHVREGIDDTTQQQRLDLHHVDLGELGKWGRPVSYVGRNAFPDYTDWLWQGDRAPDLVLIDGRFRVCCFLSSLKYAAAGTKILFDDYVNRRYYHVVEAFVDRQETCGRQALFLAPGSEALDMAKLDAEIAAFRCVMD